MPTFLRRIAAVCVLLCLCVAGLEAPSASAARAVRVAEHLPSARVPLAPHASGTQVIDGWSEYQMAATELPDLSCDPAGDLCAAAEGNGEVDVTSNPAGGLSAWTHIQVAPTKDGMVYVSCPSSSLCVAVDGAGNLYTSTTPKVASSWQGAAVNAVAVSCPSASMCVMLQSQPSSVTDQIETYDTVVSSNPANPSSYTQDPEALPANGNYFQIDSFTCASGSTLCSTVGFYPDCPTNMGSVCGTGGEYAVTNPNVLSTGWPGLTVVTTSTHTVTIDNLACPSTQLCVLGDPSGLTLVSSPPSSNAWSPAANEVTTQSVTDVMSQQCATGPPNPCLRVFGNGDIETEPTGTGNAWTAPVDIEQQVGQIPPGQPESMACDATQTLCIIGDRQGNILVNGATAGVTVAAGNPVPEPATGSTAMTFTVSLPQVQSTDTTVQYKTVDGSAVAASNAYTAVPNGSVTIPAGQSSAQIQVQIDDGNGTANAPTQTFQVQLTSSTGPAISSSAGSATGTIQIPEIQGTVTDQNAKPLGGATVTLTGMAADGSPVSRQATSASDGTYQLYADPGSSYTLSATPPTSSPGALDPSQCPGGQLSSSSTPATCVLPLNSGASLSVNFSQGQLVVSAIAFQQLNASTDEVETVPATGAVDGNRVEVTATIRNTGSTDMTTDVQFGSPIDNSAVLGTTVSGVTVPAGQAVNVDQILNTSGLAWPDNGTPGSPRQIKITLTNGNATLTQGLTVIPKPVIMVHGLASSASTWAAYLGPSGFLAQANPQWGGYAVGDGQAPGVMDTSAFEYPGKTIAQNAVQLAKYINGVMEKTDAQHVDVVAHSLGGLITRYYIQELMPSPLPGDSAPVIDHLVMLGTPNLGSNCAYLALGAEVESGVQLLSGGAASGLNQPLYQLTPSYMSQFNAQITNAKNVAFSILAGNGFHSASCTGVGPNDGVVSVKNAEWTIPDRAVANLNHIEMTGSYAAFNGWVAPHLELDPGLAGGGTYSSGTLTGAGANRREDRRGARIGRDDRLGADLARAVAAARSLPDGLPLTKAGKVCLAATADPTVAAGATVSLKAGRSASTAISVPRGAGSLTVTLLAPSDVTTALLAPSGRTKTSIAAGAVSSTGLFRTLTVSRPAAGAWHLRLSEAKGGSASQITAAVVLGHQPITAKLAVTESKSSKAGVTLRFSVTASGAARIVAGARVKLGFQNAAGKTLALKLKHAISHHYTATSTVLSVIPPTLQLAVVGHGASLVGFWTLTERKCA